MPNESLLVSGASYRSATLVHYISSPRAAHSEGIGLIPIFDAAPTGPFTIDQLRGSIFFVRQGLERTFIYKYSDGPTISRVQAGALLEIPTEKLEAVAVAVPSEAVGKTVQGDRTSIPAYEHDNGIAKFYPPTFEKAQVAAIQVRYELPPTSGQKLILKVGLKLLGVLITPLLGLSFLPPKDIGRPLLRRIALWSGAAIQLAILAVLVWTALRVGGQLGADAITDLTLAIVGALVAGVVFIVKK